MNEEIEEHWLVKEATASARTTTPSYIALLAATFLYFSIFRIFNPQCTISWVIVKLEILFHFLKLVFFFKFYAFYSLYLTLLAFCLLKFFGF